MKAIILALCLLTMTIFSSFSVKVNDDDVKAPPAKVNSEFAKLYPTVKDVKWHTEDGNYEGNFTYNNKGMSVQISEKGELIQTEIYLKAIELPKALLDYITKNYKGEKFNEYSEVTDAKNVKHFQAETKDKVLVFNSKGTFVKEEKNDDDLLDDVLLKK
jgi:hypothetical protein